MKRVLSLIAILATFITTAVAQQAYCQLDQTTLTFYYGQKPLQGAVWEITGDWNTACKEIVTDVVFDQSFAKYEVTSCANWFKDFTILESVDAQYLNLNAGNINGMFNGCVKLKSLTIGSSFTFRNDQESDRLNMFNGCTALATGTLIVKGNSAPTISDGYFFQNIFDTDKLCTLITDPANLLDGQFGNDYEEGNKTFKRYKAGFFYRFNKATHAITIASSNLGTVTIDKVDGFSSFGDDVAAAGEKVLIDVSGIADGYELSELNVTYTGNDSQTHTIDITDEGFKQYSFTMVDYPVTVTPVFAIPKTPATVTTPPYSKNLTYNGQPQELVTAGVAYGGTMQYSLDGTTYSTNIPTQTDAGDYPVYYKAVGDDTHNDSEVGTVSAYINTASSEVTTPPTGNTLPYTGEAQELITAGVATGGTLVYKLEGGTYSESIPTATEAGEYTVYYKVDGDKNHDDTNEATVTATISQPIPVYNINVSISSYPAGGDITYSGNRTAGETITLTITPDEGYELLDKNLTVSYYDSNNRDQTISYINEENGTKSFTMPGYDVWVSALFTLIPTDGPYVELSDDSKTLTFKYGVKSAQNAWDLTDVDTWSSSCKSSVTSVVFDQTFSTVQPTSCHNWFKDFTYLESANLANLNTLQVTDFSYMFSGCSALTTLIISGNFTVTSTATITNMFYNVNATTLSVQGSTSPSIAQDIFCSVFNYARLETDNKFELDGIGVNEEYNLIEYKGGLFDTYNDYHRIEYTGWGFQINYTPKIATPGTTVTLTCSNPSFAPAVSYFDDQGTAVKLTLTEIEGGWTFKMPDAMVTIANATFQGILQLGQDNKTLTILALEQDEAWNSGFPNIAEYVQCQQGVNTELTNFVTTCQQNVEKVIIDKSVLKVSGLDVSYLFNGFSKLTSIEGLDNINMQRSHSTENMFAGCENLESLTIGSNFYIGPNDDGYSITDMFKGCDGLANGTLIVKGTTPPVIKQYIFSCFTSGTLMTEPIDLLDYSVTRDNMGNVYYCGGTFTKFNSTDEPYVSLSSDGTILTFINGEKPTTGQVWDLTAAWSTATNGSVTTVAFDESFKNVPITSCEGWFSGFTKLTTVDARFLNLGRCSSTKEMFADCSSLNDLTIGDNFFIGQADTYNTTDMFKGCTAMASGTVTIVNTSPASGVYPIINQNIFNVITSGTLMTGNGVDLSTLVEDKDDGFKWLGGNFTTYNGQQKYSIRPADPTQAASKDNPYIISNVDDMVILSKAVNAGEDWTKNTWIKIATANEIFNFDGITEFEPIGTSTNKFTSSFDGNGVTIKNLNLSGTTYTGVFGYASGGWTHTIENIRIDKSSSFASSGNYLGSLAGYAEGITITNCHNDGATVTASGTATEVGGLIGYMLSGTISDCSSNANVSGYTDVGGLMGHAGYGNGKVEMNNNTVGMALGKDETISITATAGAVGAMVGSANTCSGTGNYYNGQAITAKQGTKELTGYGFGVNQADNAYIMSATGGLFATMNPGHTGKTMTWSYDLSTKTFTIAGTPDPGYEVTSVTVSYKDANGDVQKLVRNKEELDKSWTFEVQNYPTNVEATCETALKLADPTQPASKENPYLIYNVQDMVTLAKAVNVGTAWTRNTWFKVAKENDVFDFDGITDFEPIGKSTSNNTKFTSRFDGNGVTIKNLRLTGNEYVGLFGCGYYTTTTSYIKSEISNITIDASCSFTANTNYAGAIVASTNYTDIINCHNMGATVIANTSYAGGIVAQAGAGTTISGCTSKADVTAKSYAGGIAGLATATTMTNNLVGMDLAEGETITINCGNGGGAIVSNINNVSGSDNFYNGMAVILNASNATYQGHGYAYWRSDNDVLKSATGGYFPAITGHQANGLTWDYNLYTKAFTINGAPDPGYEVTSVTVSYKDANGDVQNLVRSKEELDKSWTFEVQNYPTNVEATCETALRLADPTQPASKENPYLINNVNDMVTLAKAVNAGQAFTKNTWFKVAKENDIFDFENVTDFEPIGISTSNNTKFTSRFDGNGVTIKNLRLTGNEYVGLFGCGYYTTTTSYIKSEISNITIDASCSFTANTNYAGAIVASTNYTDIINCHNLGAAVEATKSYAGGIVGQAMAGTTIDGCTSKADVTAKSYAGGIAGLASYTTMTNNLVGMDMAEGETITIKSGNGCGAIASNIGNVTGSENYYNGMAVIINSGNVTYQGHGYGYWRSDNDFLKSATGGYFPAITGHQAKGLTWNYNLYNKAFTITGAPDPGYELTSVTVSYKDANGDVQKLVRSKEQLDESWTFEVQNHPTNVEATIETALKPADPTKAASKDNPYLIHNVHDMVILSKIVNAKVSWSIGSWFKVADENAVFDFEGIEDFEPIGTNNCFMSSFDGNGVTIKNLHVVKDNSDFVGLFGSILPDKQQNSSLPEKIYIKNIRIDSSCSFQGKRHTGSLAGYCDGLYCHLYIENCHNEGATVINTNGVVGGLIGYVMNWVTIDNNSSWGDCTGTTVGGLIGHYYAPRSSGYSFVQNNQVGLTIPEGKTMTLTGNTVSAVLTYRQAVSLANNYYNGAIVLKTGGKENTGHTSDTNGISCATSGYCGISTENSGKNVEWKYDLYTKDFTVFGTGATADYTASMAPSIVKDEIETLTISEGVTGIGAKAFSGWTSLNTVTFDGCTLTSAASDAFDGCTAMAEGTVIVNKTVPMAADVATDFWNIVTGGTLQTAEGVDLGDDVTRDGDVFLWKSGTFSSYLQMRSIAGISFSDDKHWATFYTEGESLTAPENVTVYVVDAIEDNEVTISAIDYIPAGVGVLLYSETPATSLSTTVYTGSEKNCSSLLEGAITETTLQREAGYILLKDEFVLTSGGKLPAHRCYLPISNNNARQKASRMRIKIGEGTTAIESLDAQIRTVGEGWYTIDGRKLDEQPIRKGLYIHNGKKVFVK